MRKISLVLIVISLLLLTGCSRKKEVVFSVEDQTARAAESVAVTSDAKSDENETISLGPSESMTDENIIFSETDGNRSSDAERMKTGEGPGTAAVQTNAAQSTVSADTSARPTVPAQVKGETAASAMPPSAVSSAAASMPEASSAPPVSQPTTPPESSSPADAPSQAESQPESSVPSMPVIDIDYYINYAIAYGQSIGLTYLPGESDSWNAPTVINGSNREAVEREIREGLDYTKQIDKHTTFHVWAVKRPDGKYELYGI